MSRRQRIVVLLIAVALVCFFVYGIGSQYAPSKQDLESRYVRAVAWLGERLESAEPVLLDDFSAPCRIERPEDERGSASGPSPGPTPGADPSSAPTDPRPLPTRRPQNEKVERGERGGKSLWDRYFRRGDRPEVVDDVQLLVDGSCVVTVEPAEPEVRELVVRTSGELVVVAPAPDGGATVEARVEPDDATGVAIGPDGAKILLRCVGDAACEVEVGSR